MSRKIRPYERLTLFQSGFAVALRELGFGSYLVGMHKKYRYPSIRSIDLEACSAVECLNLGLACAVPGEVIIKIGRSYQRVEVEILATYEALMQRALHAGAMKLDGYCSEDDVEVSQRVQHLSEFTLSRAVSFIHEPFNWQMVQGMNERLYSRVRLEGEKLDEAFKETEAVLKFGDEPLQRPSEQAGRFGAISFDD